MKPNEYEFNIGDRVVTVYGEIGHIVDICKCEKCVERGFFEPIWVEDDGFIKQYITINDIEYGLDAYRQIGKYRFNHPFSRTMAAQAISEHERGLAKWKKRLRVMEEFEKEGD